MVKVKVLVADEETLFRKGVCALQIPLKELPVQIPLRPVYAHIYVS